MKTQLDYRELDRTRAERCARIADALTAAVAAADAAGQRVEWVTEENEEDVSHDDGRDEQHGC